MNENEIKYLKKTKEKLRFNYDTAILDRAHEIFKNNKNIKVWNLTKIVKYEILIMYNHYSKATKGTIKEEFKMWNPISKSSKKRYNNHKNTYSTLELSKYDILRYNEIYNYFTLRYKKKVSKYAYNNFLIDRFLLELAKEQRDTKNNRYLNFLKAKKHRYKKY